MESVKFFDNTNYFKINYKMLLADILLSFVSIFKTKALECISVVNQKCMARL